MCIYTYIHICAYICKCIYMYIYIYGQIYKYNLLSPFSLFACIWFQGWPLCIRQSIRGVHLSEKLNLLLQELLVTHSSFAGDGNPWNLPPSTLACPLIWQCSCLVYAAFSRKGYFMSDFLIVWLLTIFLAPPLKYSQLISAWCPAVVFLWWSPFAVKRGVSDMSGICFHLKKNYSDSSSLWQLRVSVV